MHPPFFTVDHKIGPDIHHHSDSKPVIRRGIADRLRLTPSVPGWPPVPLNIGMFGDNSALLVPTGSTVTPPVFLQVVPLPQRTWRDFVGRLLIRVGQRLIMDNRATGN